MDDARALERKTEFADEGSEAPPAGPVAGEDPSSSQAAGEEPTAEWEVLGLGPTHIAQVVAATRAGARKSAILVALAR